MNDSELVGQFIYEKTHEDPGRCVPLAAVVRLWRREHDEWTRSRFLVAAVRAGYSIAQAKDRRTVLVGRSLRPARRLEIVDGRVVSV